MDIAWYRDLVICIWGFVATLVVIMVGILSVLLYTKLKPILDSLKATSSAISSITSTVKDEVVTPVVELAVLIRGINQGIDLVSRLFRKGKEA